MTFLSYSPHFCFVEQLTKSNQFCSEAGNPRSIPAYTNYMQYSCRHLYSLVRWGKRIYDRICCWAQLGIVTRKYAPNSTILKQERKQSFFTSIMEGWDLWLTSLHFEETNISDGSVIHRYVDHSIRKVMINVYKIVSDKIAVKSRISEDLTPVFCSFQLN